MKIIFLGSIKSFNYYTIGGVENYIRRLSKYLIEFGHSINYVYYNSDIEKVEEINESFKIFYYKIENNIEFRSLLDNILSQNAIVIPIYIDNKYRLQFLFKSITNKYKSNVVKFLFNWPTNFLKRFLYFFEAKLISKNIVCLSDRQCKYLKLNLNMSSNISLGYPIVPKSFYSNLEYKISNFDEEKINVVFIGRLDKGKGIDDVLKIMNLLNKNINIACKIYGIYFPDDEYGKKIHNKLNKQTIIEYIPVKREFYTEEIENKIGEIFQNCDVFLQPYRNISSTVDAPLLIYEAMAALTIIVSRNVGELSKIIGSNQFLFESDNNDDFIVKVVESISQLNKSRYAKELERLNIHNKSWTLNKELKWLKI